MITLNSFFNINPNDTIYHKPSHFILSYSILIVCLLFMYIKREDLKNNPKFSRRIEITLAFLLIISMLSHMIWHYYNGVFTLRSLPLDICPMVSIVFSYEIITKKYKISKLLSPWALGGGIGAVLVLDVYYDPNHFRFYEYLVLHLVNGLLSLYFMAFKGMIPGKKDFIPTCIYSYSYLTVMVIINVIFDMTWVLLHEDCTLEKYFGEFVFPLVPNFYLLTGISIYIIYSLSDYIRNKKDVTSIIEN